MRLDVTADPPADAPLPEAAAAKKDLAADEQVCMLFRIPGSRFEILEARHRRTDGTTWLTVEIKPADCLRG